MYVSTTANKCTACLFQITGMQSSREIKLQQPCDTSVTHSHDKRFTSDYAKGTPKHTTAKIFQRRLYWTDTAHSQQIHVEPKRTWLCGLREAVCWFCLRNEGWTDGLFFNPVYPLLVSVSICCSIPLESWLCHFELSVYQWPHAYGRITATLL